MQELGVQGDAKRTAKTTPKLILPAAVMANKRRAPVAILSYTKRIAIIECFSNNGLHKRSGYWCGTPEGKHISGVTVADLARDGMLSSAACAAPASAPLATVATRAQDLSHVRRGPGRCECVDSHSADIALPAPSSAPSQARRQPPSGSHSAAPIVPPKTACRPAEPRDRAPGHTPLAAGEPARLPIF